MKISFSILSITILAISHLVGCGSKVNTTEVKEYRVALNSKDATFKPIIKALVSDYNSKLGFKAMEYVDSADQANSHILVTEGLEKRDGKVGWGQWFSDTERSGVDAPGSSIDKTTSYTFQAEFDADFIRKNSDVSKGELTIEVQKLFAHEIGHGFMLDHHPDQKNVMYYDITGNKDFTDYWPRIKSFFGM